MAAAPRAWWATPLAALLAVGPAAAQGEARRTYVQRAQDQEGPLPRLLGDLERAQARRAAPEEVAYLLDRLLEEAAAPAAQGLVVEAGPERFVGLRAHVIERCHDLPAAVVEALRALQGRVAAAPGRADDPAVLVRRYPFAAAAGAAWRALLSRAMAAGDAAEARAHLAWLERLHPDQAGVEARAADALLRALDGDAAGARRALEALKAGDEAARQAAARAEAAVAAALRSRAAAPAIDGAAPAPRWTALIGQPDDPPADACLVHPRLVRGPAGDHVVASTGGRVVVVDAATGAVKVRLPHLAEATSSPPDAQARFAARVAAWEGVAFTPLVLERWLVPARSARGADLAGRHYGLVALDAGAGRLLWWDGDAGPHARGEREPRGEPPGLGGAPAPLLEAVRRGHVVAVAADARRVHVALLAKADEPALALFAYERAGGGGQALVLRPAWGAPVTLFAAERPRQASPEDEPVAPELAAALTLDGAGRLLVTTDVGVTACLEAATGEVLWLLRPEPARAAARVRPLVRRGATPLAEPAPAPAVIAPRPDGSGAVVLAGDRVLCARLADGTIAWSAPRGRTARLLLAGEHVVAYGEDDLLVCDAATGAVRHRGAPGDAVCGEGAAAGRWLALPVRDGAAAKVRLAELGADGQVTRRALVPLPEHTPPFNLALTARGLVVASGRHVSLLAWER
ncbi:MAG: PQQ-like beta-propeller repeat protein [Planctomycetes bacterium]|nr:PQQ-like beta-propeller repeat protein [Planctomycetota bacterium]